MLAAHDANLSRIREDIATMEAAERLLKDTSPHAGTAPARDAGKHPGGFRKERDTGIQNSSVTFSRPATANSINGQNPTAMWNSVHWSL